MSLWPVIHTERAALAHDLEALNAESWQTRSLCGSWTAEDVVAHLIAVARIGRVKWFASMAGAKFNPAVHNQRRQLEQHGTTPDETLANFYASRDFAVNSKCAMKGLRLEATDGLFKAGDGLLVTGSTLALTMAMAGRAGFCAELEGEGVPTLLERCATM